MHVVATAGHVDHGKSTLLRALTGQEPDRLAEERRRGLSIALGYVWCRVDPVGEVAFIDVPGHQKFVSTALAGLGQAPVAMLVVAADDPWMPQAEEHLAALDALGVNRGVLVLTRCDLADPAESLARARERLATTSLADIPAVSVSARTGEGLDRLREVLGQVLAMDPPQERGTEQDVRFWVDRSFIPKGEATVVTGTLESGRIEVGDDLTVTLESGPHTLRVRSLESLGLPREGVRGPARVALQLTGRGAKRVRQGQVLTTVGAFASTDVVDVRLRPAPPSTGAALPRQPLLHVGSATAQVQVRALAEGFLRVRLPEPLPLRVGDRLLLRDPGSRAVWGCDVLDPDPAPSTGRGFAGRRSAELRRLDLTAAADLELRGLARASSYRQWFGPGLQLPPETIRVNDWAISPDHAARIAGEISRLVADAEVPPTPAAVARTLGLPQPVVERLVPSTVRARDGRWVIGSDRAPLSEPDRLALAALAGRLQDALFDAPDLPTMRAMGLDDATVARLHRAGEALRLTPGVVLLPGADVEALRLLVDLPQPFTTSAARQHLGATRRVTLALLAHLDRQGRTVRLADDTRRLRP